MTRRMLVFASILGLMILGLAATVNADAGNRPFRGSMQGDVTFNYVGEEICPKGDLFYGGLRSDSDARGTLTHLGRTRLLSHHCTPAGEAVTGGLMTLFAANGDQVDIAYSGSAPFPIPGVTEFVEVDIDFEITGGTGRFAGATGGGEMAVSIEFLGFGVETWPAVWEIEGVIGY